MQGEHDIFEPMQHSSRYIEAAVDQMSSLTGIGRKTALRLVLELVKRDASRVELFAKSFTDLKEHIQFCSECHNLADESLCSVCKDQNRDRSLVCVVDDIRDVMAIESTQHYRGMYHVLGGRISPMDGVGPDDLSFDSLFRRVSSYGEGLELILGLSATMEGDTSSFYIYQKVKEFPVKLSTIARGIGVGTELEYADEITLGRSIMNRTPFELSLSRP